MGVKYSSVEASVQIFSVNNEKTGYRTMATSKRLLIAIESLAAVCVNTSQ